MFGLNNNPGRSWMTTKAVIPSKITKSNQSSGWILEINLDVLDRLLCIPCPREVSGSLVGDVVSNEVVTR
jgi:hypothetical protein